MPDPFVTLGRFTLPTYTALLALGVLASVAALALAYRWRYARPVGPLVDACLGALLGGVVLARAGHVLLHRYYFEIHPDEIIRLSAGGLDWHGALVGGLLGFALVSRWRGLDARSLFDWLAPVVPALALLAWWGCGAAHCAYGAEVETLADYPGWLVWEAADVYNIRAPRYAVQPLGMGFSGGLLLLVLGLMWRGWLRGRLLGLALLVLALGMFALGFLRGDYNPTIGPLRADQALDLLLAGGGLALLALVPRHTPRPPQSLAD